MTTHKKKEKQHNIFKKKNEKEARGEFLAPSNLWKKNMKDYPLFTSFNFTVTSCHFCQAAPAMTVRNWYGFLGYTSNYNDESPLFFPLIIAVNTALFRQLLLHNTASLQAYNLKGSFM